MSQYKWAANPVKLARAIATTKSSDEDVIKTEYIRLGGLIIGSRIPVAEKEEVPAPIEVTDGVTEEVEVSSRKILKRKAK